MLIIERNYRTNNEGYTVRSKEKGMGRGWTSQAANLEEVSLAIQHYYEHHPNAGAHLEACPFCRDTAHRYEKKQRKHRQQEER
jgi:hypothetical protein